MKINIFKKPFGREKGQRIIHIDRCSSSFGCDSVFMGVEIYAFKHLICISKKRCKDCPMPF